MRHEDQLAQISWLARLMATISPYGHAISLRRGLGGRLFPDLGNVLTSAISLLIVHHAWQTGTSKFMLARMLGNVGIDFVVGAIPFLRDLFDFAFKANRRNTRLLKQHLHKQTASRGR
jgi:Domain of unknown function (DUF4112)